MLIDAVVLVGIVGVLPLALGHPLRWSVVAIAAAAAMWMPTGIPAATAAGVWWIAAVVGVVEALGVRRSWRVTGLWHRPLGEWAALAAAGFAVVASSAFIAASAGVELFGIGEPIVTLTSVHFTYAGVGAVTLAGVVAERYPVGGAVALGATIAAPPIVAVGFLVQHALPQVGGAVLMSVAVLCTATLQLRTAWTMVAPRSVRGFLAVSGLAPWAPMCLAVAWAASQYWSVPALSIPEMARTHGVMNVVFVLAGLWARHLLSSDPSPRPLVVAAGP